MTIGNEELDALRELINIGVGRAAGALNDMMGRNVRLNVPRLEKPTSRQMSVMLFGVSRSMNIARSTRRRCR